jgi:hypothetical protein
MIVGTYRGELEARLAWAWRATSGGRWVASGDCYRFRLHDRRR